MVNNLLIVISIGGLALGIVASCIVLFSNKTYAYSSRLLALLLTAIAGVFFATFLFERSPEVYAHVSRLPSPLLYILFPAAYLYSRSVFHGETKFNRQNILHFVPAVIYLVSMMPHYLSTYSYKLNLVKEIRKHPNQFVFLNDGILPKYFNLAFLCLQSIFYIFLIILILRKAKFTKDQDVQSVKISVYKWVKAFVIFSASIIAPLSLMFLVPQQFSNTAVQFLLCSTVFSFVTVHLLLFFKPHILYGIPQLKNAGMPNNDLHSVAVTANDSHCVLQAGKDGLNGASSSLYGSANLECYKPVLEKYMHSVKPFLKQGYTLQNLSRDTNIPSHHLSPLLNRIYKLRFTDYINGMRIRYIEENFENADWENLTLEGIAKQAGFTSRTTFFNAIKKVTGVTPSEFVAEIRRQQSKINSSDKEA